MIARGSDAPGHCAEAETNVSEAREPREPSIRIAGLAPGGRGLLAVPGARPRACPPAGCSREWSRSARSTVAGDARLPIDVSDTRK
jgi:hypothetical protein